MKLALNKANHLTQLHILGGLGLLLCSQWLYADATIVYEQSVGKHKAINTMQIKEGNIRITPPSKTEYSLFNSQSDELTHIDVSKKQYLVMNKQTIENQVTQAKQQMEMMRQRMMEKMKDMPPERKKQVEQMMNNHLSRVDKSKPAPKLIKKKTGRTEIISGIQCDVYEASLNGVKHSELCTTKPDQMGLSQQDIDALLSMQKFMKHMQKVAQSITGSSVQSDNDDGVPLHTILFNADGSVKMETRLSSLSTEAINSQTVMIPEGFSPMKMPQPSMR